MMNRALFCSILIVGFMLPVMVSALPLYTMSTANECDTCHVEPLGWANPDLSDRRCTFDCVGCHVSPAGGGLRLADGQYMGKEVLPMFGDRPSSFSDNDKRRPKGFPKEGKWSWSDGFSGWWAGKLKHTDIEDRYGDINPKPKWKLGGDFRFAILSQALGGERENYIFPMQADLYLLNESTKDLQLYVNAGIQGYKDTDQYTADEVEISDYFAIKELFLKYRYKYNTWFMLGRFTPRYGWRTADHTAFARQDLGFNQYYQAFGGAIGINPNYFYADVSGYATGLADWPGERLQRGAGGTLNLGWRDFGYNVGLSGAYFDQNTSQEVTDGGDGGIRQITGGINGSLNFNPFIWFGEINVRQTTIPGDDTFEPAISMIASHEFNYRVAQGFYAKFKYDWTDGNIKFEGDHKHRLTLGADLHPYTFVNFELLYRLGFGPVSPLAKIGTADVSEFMLNTHVWF